jgi:hypothetical protein
MIEDFETALVKMADNMFEKLIVPSCGIVEYLGPLWVEMQVEVTEKIDLSVGGGFFKHPGSLNKLWYLLFYMS